MNITDIIIRKFGIDCKVKATASVTFDDEFVLHGIRIIDGDKGLFIAMPQKKLIDGTYKDIAHPLNTDTRKVLQEAVLEAYEEYLKNQKVAAIIEKNLIKEIDRKGI